MTSKSKDNKTRPTNNSAARRWLIVSSCVWIVLIAAFMTRSWPAVWAAVLFQLTMLVYHWVQWLITRHNLARIPLLGHGLMAQPEPPLPRVAVIAPARNEARDIEPAVRSMAALDYPNLEVVAVNDHSTDETGDILDRLAAEFPCIRVIHDPPRQSGWGGKQNAVWQAVQRVSSECDWLLLTDADIMFGPTVVRDAVAYAEREGADFVTCLPFLETDSLMQELLLVSGWHQFLFIPRYAGARNQANCGTGIGAFMLIRRETYLAAGGHSAIAGTSVEDTSLARIFRKTNAVMRFAWAGDQLRCHQYHGWTETVEGRVQKRRRVAMRSAGAYFSTISSVLIPDVLPLPLVAGSVYQLMVHGFSTGFAALALLSFLTYVQSAVTYRAASVISTRRPVAAWLHPLGGILRLWVCLKAIGADLRGLPLQWRGRDVGNPKRVAELK